MRNSEGKGLVGRHRHNGEDVIVSLQEISDAVSDWVQFISFQKQLKNYYKKQ